jgi:hypothetical protein
MGMSFSLALANHNNWTRYWLEVRREKEKGAAKRLETVNLRLVAKAICDFLPEIVSLEPK